MPKTQLSDLGLRSFKAPQKGTVDYWDSALPSFGCRVSQGGAKTFILKIQNSRRAIGRWPLISLADARREARRLLAEKTLGKVRPQSITVQQARELFLEEKAKSRRPRTVDDLQDRLTRHFSIQGQIADVTHQEIVRRLSRIKTVHEHDAALRVGKTFFTWAMNRRYISDSPFRGVSPHGSQSRARVLTDAELKLIYQTVTRETTAFNTIVALLILTGQRRGEIAALQSSFFQEVIDPKTYLPSGLTCTLPATLTKNGREHPFPIGALAAKILKATLSSTSNLLFPARGTTDKPFNGWSKSKAALDKASGVTGWTLHDIRRTYRSNLGRIGVAPHIAERLVNHVSAQTDMERVYDQYKYMPEMRAAVEKYEDFLQSILK